MAENGSSDMVKAMATLAQMKAGMSRRKASIEMAKALVKAMIARQQANVIKGELRKATGINLNLNNKIKS